MQPALLPAQEGPAARAQPPSRVVAQGPWSWLFKKKELHREDVGRAKHYRVNQVFLLPRLATGCD